MSAQPCGKCGGTGSVVVPKPVPKDDGTYDMWWVAETCGSCGGRGTV